VLFIYLQKEIAKNLVEENGKTMADAEGDVLRGLRKYLIAYAELFIIYIIYDFYTSFFI